MKFETDVVVVLPNKSRARGVLHWEAEIKQEKWGLTDISPSIKSEGPLSVVDGFSEARYDASETTIHEIKPCPVPSKMIGLTPSLVEVGKDGKISKIQYVSNAA